MFHKWPITLAQFLTSQANMLKLTTVLIYSLLGSSVGNYLDQQVASAVNSLVSGSSSNTYDTSSSYYPAPIPFPLNYWPNNYFPYNYGNNNNNYGSYPYYDNNNNYDGYPYNDGSSNWNYGMPVPALTQPNVHNGMCYYFFNTAMVYDMSTRGQRIATPQEQREMKQCYYNRYYVPCLCPQCSSYLSYSN
uniref:Uncharacterized protein n=1 Tax=Steinernema glaseri TaxID=37863 RepID=A0A1I7YPJ0_9BILA